ncbi:L,D-transpeptidase family protein [uncultured Mycolicibacterium sp.]|uniref:L,D-transpeptidase family protein n=1 Tax=uncultured Mycolicibacterium sp. TaxID=2320817 RepID=UPI002608E020|nr:L,D-transpeptidase family protein [uncultured Mycolicibacterium sp.]
MRRLLVVVCATALALVVAPTAHAGYTPWFARSVGAATQVISVVGVGGSSAKVDVWQRTARGWQPVGAGIPAFIGAKGMSPNHFDGSMMTPMGIYTLDFAFGTEPDPGSGLPYVQVTPDHWWDGDMKSPTYNTMQVCRKQDCPFSTALADGTENLYIPQYRHAVVMGVNKARIPGRGGAFFVHTSGGGPTAGCVAIEDDTLVRIMRWLRPGALIALTKT